MGFIYEYKDNSYNLIDFGKYDIQEINMGGNINYYVAPYGKNANDGLSIDKPKQNFDKENWFNSENIKPGDTIYLLNGTWMNESIDFNTISGTAYQPITLATYTGKPTLDGGSIMIGGIGANFASEYINIHNIIIKNTNIGIKVREAKNINIENSEIGNIKSHAVFIIDSYNIIFKNNDVHDTGHNSIFIQSNGYNVHDIYIINNSIHDNPGKSGKNGHNLIDLYIYGKNVGLKDILIEGNELYNVDTNGIFEHEEDGSNGYVQMTNITIKNNILWNIGTNAIKINYLGDSLISDNIILNANDSGFKSDLGSFNKGGFYDGIILQNNYVKFSGGEAISLAGRFENNSILLQQNNIDTYRINRGTGIVEDPQNNVFHLRTENGGNIILRFTDKRSFNISGDKNMPYSDGREFVTKSDEFVTVMISSDKK